ncbi:protein of unknown function [Thermococcus nautili]|uniref:hypothetical protein n=1 Tax=Thermococcus nautili TaxID=195522 RepID=UPI00255729D7|nr:hypothetical protein [Thermococcus nautili]CAI1492050.1 protein of unknown function [Thermococcus nautili]
MSEEQIEKVVEMDDGKTIIRYSKETGLVISQYVYDIEDGIVFSKYLVGKIFLDDKEILALEEVLTHIKEVE